MMIAPSFHVIVEFVAFVSAVLFCRKKTKAMFFLFIPYLLYTFTNEYVGEYISEVYTLPNYYLYNIYVPVSFLFFSFLISRWVGVKKYRLLITITTIAGLVFAVCNALWGQGFWKFNTFTITITSILIIFNCFMYLFDLLKQSDGIVHPLKEPAFWIITGLLFFNFGGLVVNVLHNYAIEYNFKINGKRMYDVIFRFLNFLMYTSFIIAFRLCYKKTNSISLS